MNQTVRDARILRLRRAIEKNAGDTEAILGIIGDELDTVEREGLAERKGVHCPVCGTYDKAELERQIAAWNALIAAVKVINWWHNLGQWVSEDWRKKSWCSYWHNSRDMAPIREALAGVDLDNPEAL